MCIRYRRNHARRTDGRKIKQSRFVTKKSRSSLIWSQPSHTCMQYIAQCSMHAKFSRQQSMKYDNINDDEMSNSRHSPPMSHVNTYACNQLNMHACMHALTLVVGVDWTTALHRRRDFISRTHNSLVFASRFRPSRRKSRPHQHDCDSHRHDSCTTHGQSEIQEQIPVSLRHVPSRTGPHGPFSPRSKTARNALTWLAALNLKKTLVDSLIGTVHRFDSTSSRSCLNCWWWEAS